MGFFRVLKNKDPKNKTVPGRCRQGVGERASALVCEGFVENCKDSCVPVGVVDFP